ncbi:hypothetical protein Tco_0268078 [Tanacetum coccineum]
MESLNSNSQERERELHQLQQMQHKAKESCKTSFQLLHSFLQVLSYNELKINGEKQLGKEEFQETRSMDASKALKYDRRVNKRLMQTQESKVVLGKELDANLVVMESNGTKSGKHDTSSHSGNYITHSVGADIRLVNDQVLFAEVQLTAQDNVLANEQQHTEQSEPIYDTYLLEKINRNTTPDSTNISHRRGEIDRMLNNIK